MNPEFEVHILNPAAIEKAKELASVFDKALNDVLAIIERPGTSGSITLPRAAMNGRFVALVKTHMELASFYAKKAMAVLPENQK
jgi:hypothetical protein